MRSYLGQRKPRPSFLKKAPGALSDLLDVFERGKHDRAAGVAYLSNPYLTDDPRFAAWNDGWLGSDELADVVAPMVTPPDI